MSKPGTGMVVFLTACLLVASSVLSMAGETKAVIDDEPVLPTVITAWRP